MEAAAPPFQRVTARQKERERQRRKIRLLKQDREKDRQRECDIERSYLREASVSGEVEAGEIVMEPRMAEHVDVHIRHGVIQVVLPEKGQK